MRPGQIDLTGIAFPIVLHPSAPVSDDDLMRFSEQNKPFQIERNKEGDITIMTPVNYRGGKHEGYVAAALLLWADQDARGSAVPANVGFSLPDGSCLAPDAAWISKEREATLTAEQLESFPPLCPDFIIEIRSKSDPRRIVEAKMHTWIDNGAKLAWLIDPIDCTVTVYRPDHLPETLNHPEILVATAPVQGFELQCTRLWTS